MIFALIGSFLSAAIAILMAIVALSYNGYVKRKKIDYLSQQAAVYYTQGGQAYYNPNMGYRQQTPTANTQIPYQNQAYYVPPVTQPGQPPYAGDPVPVNQPVGQQAPESTVSQIPVQQAQEPQCLPARLMESKKIPRKRFQAHSRRVRKTSIWDARCAVVR